jgi:rhodanese-related sulfurtransferase
MTAEAASGEISAADLLDALRVLRGELALLDVREEARYATGHILLATSLPLSRMELRIGSLVPRRACRIVLYDDGEGLAATAVGRLRQLGYSDVLALRGGLPAWLAAGYEVFNGLNAPSKALGVFAQQELRIPDIEPQSLAVVLEREKEIQIVDCRPFAEYQRGSIPGASNCPGVELLRHVPELGADRTVITCAGRTRGLLGVQTLIDFGVDARLVALRDGTMGWELAGQTVEKAATRRLNGKAAIPAVVRKSAERIRKQAGIPALTSEALARWRADADRTAYIFDIREAAEFHTGHIAGAQPVAGGQLIQNLDMNVAALGSRIVVADDDGIRATAVALWLRRMGWRDVAITQTGITQSHQESSTSIYPPSVAAIGVEALKAALDRGEVLLIDLATSRDYRGGHIPGAWFAVRSRLTRSLASMPSASSLVLTSEDGVLAAFASTDGLPFKGDIRVLEGGTAAWRASGLPLSKSLDRLADAMDDMVLKPSELTEGREDAMRDYLSGSEGLLERIQRDGTLHLTAIPVR